MSTHSGFNLTPLEVYSLLSEQQQSAEEKSAQLFEEQSNFNDSVQQSITQLHNQLDQLNQTLMTEVQLLQGLNTQLEQRVVQLEQQQQAQLLLIQDNSETLQQDIIPMYTSAKELFFDSVWKWSFGVSRISTNGVGTVVMSVTGQVFDSKYWHICDGSPIPQQYSLLRSMVGSLYPDLRSKFVRGADSTRSRQVNTYQEQQIGMHFHGTFMHALADRFVQAIGPSGGNNQQLLSGSREFIQKPVNVKPVGGSSGTLYDWLVNGYKTLGPQWESWSQSSVQTWQSSYLFDQNDQLETEEYFSIVNYNEYESLMGRLNSQDPRSFLQMSNWAMDQFITPFTNNDVRSMQYDSHFQWESSGLSKLSATEAQQYRNDKDTRPENYSVVYYIKQDF